MIYGTTIEQIDVARKYQTNFIEVMYIIHHENLFSL